MKVRHGLAVLLALTLTIGCVTTKTETETVNRLDVEATIAIAQLALTSAEQGFDLWMQYQAQNADRDQAAYEREAAARRERLDQLRSTLELLMAARKESQVDAS